MKFTNILALAAVCLLASTDTVSAGAMTAFTSVTLSSAVAGASLTPVLLFTPANHVASGGSYTLTMPAGYFIGTVTAGANNGAQAGGTMTISSAAVNADSTLIVLTTAGTYTSTSTAIQMTLTGLTLGAARAAVTGGFTMQSSTDTTATAGVNAPAITGMILASITVGSTTAGATVTPVLVFTPATSVTIAGAITLTMPPGYLRGSVTSIASGVTDLKATSTPAATATSTTIVLTTSGAATSTAAITMTLTGLTLGSARGAVTAGFQLSSSADTVSAVLDANAVTGMVLTSVTMGATASGASISPVLVFTPATSVTIAGAIILTMPAGYFLGSVHSIASSVTSLNATGSFYGPPAISNSTAIVLTTSGAATGTAAVTMTLYGLTLGSARATVTAGLQLSSSADAGLSFGVNAPEITAAAAITAAPSSTKSSGMMIQVSGLVLFVLAALICY